MVAIIWIVEKFDFSVAKIIVPPTPSALNLDNILFLRTFPKVNQRKSRTVGPIRLVTIGAIQLKEAINRDANPAHTFAEKCLSQPRVFPARIAVDAARNGWVLWEEIFEAEIVHIIHLAYLFASALGLHHLTSPLVFQYKQNPEGRLSVLIDHARLLEHRCEPDKDKNGRILICVVGRSRVGLMGLECPP